MKLWKRFFAVFVSALIAVSVLPAAALAAEPVYQNLYCRMDWNQSEEIRFIIARL